MGLKINFAPLKTPLGGILAGVFGGGALGTATGIGATAGKIIGGATANSNSPLANLWKLGGQVNSLSNSFSKAPSAGGEVGKAAGAGVGAEAGMPSAMDRALEAGMKNPAVVLHQGIKAANDPSLPFDVDTRMSILEPLVRAKHFGRVA